MVLDAEERLASGTVPDDQFYDVARVAFGSAEAASAAFTAYLAAKLRSGQTPNV